MKISIFGMGYVGCFGLGCFATSGHSVIGDDVDPSKVEVINKGESPNIENRIAEIILKQRKNGNISATDDGIAAVLLTDVSFICVGTPTGQKGHTDISAIVNVAEMIRRGIAQKEGFHVDAIRSNVPLYTKQKVARIIEAVTG